MGELPVNEDSDLSDIFKCFNESTAKLLKSYEQLQERVAELTRELEYKNRLLERRERLAFLGEMAAGIAHEIRNPLGAIKLYAGVLDRESVSDAERKELIARILNGVATLDKLIEDILAFATTVTPRLGPCDINSLIDGVVSGMSERLSHEGIEVRKDYGTIPSDFHADAGLLERVFQNVVRNAMEAVVEVKPPPPEGRRIELVTRVVNEAQRPHVRVSVADNGRGIPSDVMKRLFTPFFTTKKRGTGLGLAIAHRIVEAHGGSIEVTNAGGGGAVFSIVLPFTGRIEG